MISFIFNKLYNKLIYFIKKNELSILKSKFKDFGVGSYINEDSLIKNPHYISIGNNFYAHKRFRMEAWDSYLEENFTPKILIGNNVCFNTDIHIGCINKVVIGDNCLFGSRIYITDHDHGTTSISDLSLPPIQRKLYSKGPVIIENNVYVGEGVAILSGVTIGENSIIATNAVVTKSVPKNSLVGGVPARVIKSLI
jgi:acetyltransferase-like isoleucine patch superfamily enzyme